MIERTCSLRCDGSWSMNYSIIALLLSVLMSMMFTERAGAQVTSPPNINGGYPVGVNNLVGTNFNTQTTGTLNTLGLNQGVTFDFTGSVTGAGNWNSGLSFLTANILQVQARNTAIGSGNYATYAIDFSGDVYGLQFTKGGLDNGDETTISFYHKGVQVPVSVSTYVNGVETVPDPNNVIVFAGTNIDIVGVGGSIRADGDGNNDTGGISIHGLQEGFTINLPLDVVVDRVVFNTTGKNNGSTGNVTLIYTDFAWATPGVAVTKASNFSQGADSESTVGDLITFTYVVENTGNVPLTNVILTETAFTGTGTAPTPSFVSGTGGSTPANLLQGETLTYTATYAVTALDLLAGSIDNQVSVSALPIGGLLGTDELADLSDSANIGDGGAVGSPNEDDVTTTTFPAPIVFNPSLDVVKTADVSGLSNPVAFGDAIYYTILVTNNGDVEINSITLTDALTDGNLVVLPPPVPIFQSASLGSPEGTLTVGEVATYAFTHTVSQSDIDSESLSNTVTANGVPISGGTVSDISDDGDDLDGNTSDDPTVVSLTGTPSLDVSKQADDVTDVVLGQVVTYTYRVTNDGNQTISGISLADAHGGSGPAPIPGNENLFPPDDVAPIGDSVDGTPNDGTWDSLAPGDTVTFTANYTVTQNDVDTLQ